MVSRIFSLLIALALTQSVAVALSQKRDLQSNNKGTRLTCESQLEKAKEYQTTRDPRSEDVLLLAQSLPGCHAAFRDLAYYLGGRLRFREATENLARYLKLEPADTELRRVDLREISRGAQLQAQIDSVINPPVEDLLELARIVEAYGVRHALDSLPYAERAAKLYPESVLAKLLLARLLLITRDSDRAERLLNDALKLEPGNVRIYAAMGWNYLFGNNRKLDQAVGSFQKALTLSNDEDPNSWKGLGYVYNFQGKRYEALAAFKQYLKLARLDEKASDAEISEVKSLIVQLGDVP